VIALRTCAALRGMTTAMNGWCEWPYPSRVSSFG
jgi:hypothetical protein